MYRVLVIDDEVWMCEGLKKLIPIIHAEYEVTGTASHGKQALTLLNEQSFDVVITDINMPLMDGLELIREMRSHQFLQPVVIVSAYSEFEYARAALRYGAIDYLVKPVKNDELSGVLTNLHELLQRNANESSDDKEESSIPLHGLGGGTGLVQSLLVVIEQSYMEDLSLSLVADEAGFNPSYLSRLFKLETGKGFVEYLRDVRMKHACKALEETSLTNVEIAKLVGFWDEKHFRRTFKKAVGMTPGEYRERTKSKKIHPSK